YYSHSYCPLLLSFFLLPRPPSSTPFPYTTLFRSDEDLLAHARLHRVDRSRHQPRQARERGAESEHHRVQEADVDAERRHHRAVRSEEHTSELQSQSNLVCRLLLEKKKKKK